MAVDWCRLTRFEHMSWKGEAEAKCTMYPKRAEVFHWGNHTEASSKCSIPHGNRMGSSLSFQSSWVMSSLWTWSFNEWGITLLCGRMLFMVLVWFSTLFPRSCSFGPIKMVRFYPAHYPPLCVAGLNLCILDVWKLGQLDPKIRSHWGSERFGKSPMMLTREAGFDDEIQLPHVPTIHKLPMWKTPSIHNRPEEKTQAFLASVTEPIPRPPLDAPVPPELQLLAVLPAQSAPLLPPAMRPLVEEKNGGFSR